MLGQSEVEAEQSALDNLKSEWAMLRANIAKHQSFVTEFMNLRNSPLFGELSESTQIGIEKWLSGIGSITALFRDAQDKVADVLGSDDLGVLLPIAVIAVAVAVTAVAVVSPMVADRLIEAQRLKMESLRELGTPGRMIMETGKAALKAGLGLLPVLGLMYFGYKWFGEK
jgi:hypothetical protein